MADPRIIAVELDEHSIIRRNPDIEQERGVAIADLLAHNHFAPRKPYPADYSGPFRVRLRVEEGRLALEIADETGATLETLVLGMASFRRRIRDYFAICDSYYRARRDATPDKIETVDMARRAIHDDAATLLRERLARRIDVDHDTARRLFTLICVLHIKG